MSFVSRHIGNKVHQIKQMYQFLGESSTSMINKVIPKSIVGKFKTFEATSETSSIQYLNNLFSTINTNNKSTNKEKHFMIGLDYNDSILPNVINRNLLENPKWYTAYTPYQSEISQGRLESLFNYQTLISELTQLPVSNCSLLDTGSASVEAINIAVDRHRYKRKTMFCSQDVHPHLLEIIKTRCNILGVNLVVDNLDNINITDDLFGVYFSYPNTYGQINFHQDIISELKDNETTVISQNDIMSLLLLKPPGELGVDISLGSTQRFGLPLWYGGPHSAFFAMNEKILRKMPGRIIGESIDSNGNPAYRMTLQTREQHIKKERATSNICTSQALLANTSSMYAIYHGKTGLIDIAKQINYLTTLLNLSLKELSYHVNNDFRYDTVFIDLTESRKEDLFCKLLKNDIEVRKVSNGLLMILNEKTDISIINKIINIFRDDLDYPVLSNYVLCNNISGNNNGENDIFNNQKLIKIINTEGEQVLDFNSQLLRTDDFLNQSIFKYPKTETEMLRYMDNLVSKDYSLTNGMIPLGSCTMKLNATTQMMPLSWASVQNQHPFQLNMPHGYDTMIKELNTYLLDITGMDAISYQSNAGSMGEYAGLLCIKKYHQTNSLTPRNICFIPESAHGTNFASAKLVNLKIVKFDDTMSLDEFRELVSKYGDAVSSLMITYPNTYGIFDENIKEIIDIIHEAGGLVYMDGANMNAQCGFTSPGDCGADVCHLNLHKTFCIPHGGGGPGMGPIAVNNKLKPYLPSNILQCDDYQENNKTIGMITSSNYSSASLLTIPYLYFKLMGSEGIKLATEQAILNANYLMKKLENSYSIHSVNKYGLVGHEFIIDLSEFKRHGITDKDIAKRLIDYSFHPPTMSWPVPNSLMIEPTESEDQVELDRFVEALLTIREEIYEIESGIYDKDNNLLANAPHCQQDLLNWKYPYSIERAIFPVSSLKNNKQWPTHSRINDVYGDKNLKLKLS
jgi:glycine dehydrogenase